MMTTKCCTVNPKYNIFICFHSYVSLIILELLIIWFKLFKSVNFEVTFEAAETETIILSES